MKRIFTISVFLLIVNAAIALPEYVSAPLFDHLKEVNKEWLKQEVTPELQHHYKFTTDAYRIQKHLQLVEQRLREVSTTHLTTEQRLNRQAMLDVLHQYWLDKTFPQNLYHAHRQPYFIDDYGTACAVGYLIIASGHSTIADKIRNENNYAYIHELLMYPELETWARTFGFTVEELAWIQPGYQSDIPTEPLGGGTNGTITDIIYASWNPIQLYAAGTFTVAGGKSCLNIARWDGEEWHAVGNGLNGEVEGLLNGTGQGNIMAFGSFNNGAHQIAEWNGSSWNYSAVLPGKTGGATAYRNAFFQEKYIAGWYMDGATKKYYIASGGAPWVIIEEFNGRINDIELIYGFSSYSLVIGGEFTATTTGTTLNYIAHMDLDQLSGTFQPLGNGLDNHVRVLHSYGNALYAGGDAFDAQKNGTFGLAKWVNGSWQQVVNLAANSFDSSETYVSTIVTANNALLIGGKFEAFDMMYYGRNIGFVHETGNYISPSGNFNDAVEAIFFIGNGYYVGGKFTQIGQNARNHIAKFGASVGNIDHPGEGLALDIFPNPATDRIYMQWQENIAQPVVEVYNISGQLQHVQQEVNGQRLTIYCDKLPAGVYIYRLRNDNFSLAQGKFVVAE